MKRIFLIINLTPSDFVTVYNDFGVVLYERVTTRKVCYRICTCRAIKIVVQRNGRTFIRYLTGLNDCSVIRLNFNNERLSTLFLNRFTLTDDTYGLPVQDANLYFNEQRIA